MLNEKIILSIRVVNNTESLINRNNYIFQMVILSIFVERIHIFSFNSFVIIKIFRVIRNSVN